jgi:hypothetical protein
MEAIVDVRKPDSRHRLSRLETEARLVSAAEFRRLLVSHRKLVRADLRAERLRGLHDLDTGEIFVTDEKRLLEPSVRA